MHLGTDIGAAEGTPVERSPPGGISYVYLDRPGSLSGNALKVRTANGTYFFTPTSAPSPEASASARRRRRAGDRLRRSHRQRARSPSALRGPPRRRRRRQPLSDPQSRRRRLLRMTLLPRSVPCLGSDRGTRPPVTFSRLPTLRTGVPLSLRSPTNPFGRAGRIPVGCVRRRRSNRPGISQATGPAGRGNAGKQAVPGHGSPTGKGPGRPGVKLSGTDDSGGVRPPTRTGAASMTAPDPLPRRADRRRRRASPVATSARPPPSSRRCST